MKFIRLAATFHRVNWRSFLCWNSNRDRGYGGYPSDCSKQTFKISNCFRLSTRGEEGGGGECEVRLSLQEVYVHRTGMKLTTQLFLNLLIAHIPTTDNIAFIVCLSFKFLLLLLIYFVSTIKCEQLIPDNCARYCNGVSFFFYV